LILPLECRSVSSQTAQKDAAWSFFGNKRSAKLPSLRLIVDPKALTSSTLVTPRTKKTHFSFQPSATHAESTQHVRPTGNAFKALSGLSRSFQFFSVKKYEIKTIKINHLMKKTSLRMMICEKNVIAYDVCARLLLCHTPESTRVLGTQKAPLEMNKNGSA